MPPKLLGILSAKGGTGKTTTSIQLALALKRQGFKVGLLDADWTAPTVPIMLGCENIKPGRSRGNIVVPAEYKGIKLLSWAMLWPPDSAVLIEDRQIESEDLMYAVAMLKQNKIEAAIKYLTQLADDPGGAISHMQLLFKPGNIDWGDIDFLIVDTPPTTTSSVRVVAESDLWGTILVTHPSRPSLADLRRTIDLLRKKQVPIIGIISNQGTRNGNQSYDLTDSDVQSFATERGIPFIIAVPHDSNLVPYFDEVAKFIVVCKPLILKPKKFDEAEAMRTLKGITKLVDLLEALRR